MFIISEKTCFTKEQVGTEYMLIDFETQILHGRSLQKIGKARLVNKFTSFLGVFGTQMTVNILRFGFVFDYLHILINLDDIIFSFLINEFRSK